MKTEKEHRQSVILIVDDDRDLLLVMAMKMKAEGYETYTSYNGQDLDNLITAHRPDMILLDITMDGVSGIDICRRLKAEANTKAIPLLMFSANRDLVKIATTCGADDYLPKPFDILELKEKIKNFTGY